MRPLIFFILVMFSLDSDAQEKLHTLGKLPINISESSGLAYESSNSLWTLNDGGSGPILFNIDTLGTVIKSYTLKDVKNYDWEALTIYKGSLYIGDFGNNLNKRKKLQIHKIKINALRTENDPKIKTIYFHYNDQDKFPPDADKRYFDCEAMVVKNDSIYLITKNRTDPFNGKIRVYRMSHKQGTHKAKRYQTYYTTGSNKLSWWITDAVLVENNLYLLSHSKVFKVSNFGDENNHKTTLKPIDLGHFSQKEAICHDGKHTFYITDEKLKFLSPKIYRIELP